MHTSVLTTTIMFLILPLLIIAGLIPLTKFAFTAQKSETGTEGRQQNMLTDIINKYIGDPSKYNLYSITLSERDMFMCKVAVVSTWILVILSILSWVGRAFNLWCFP
jgi:hypothetical protein